MELAVEELPEHVKGSWLIGKQVETGSGIFVDLNLTGVDAMINPVWRNVQMLGDLRNGKVADDPSRVRLATLLEDAMLKADNSDGAGQDPI